MNQDGAGRTIRVGDRVRFRGKEYTIKKFLLSTGTCDTPQIQFEEDQHTSEIADEISVSLI